MKQGNIDYEWLAAKFDALRTTQPDGTPAFIVNDSRYSYDELFSLFETHAQVDVCDSDSQRQQLLKNALRTANRSGKITADSLKKGIATAISDYKKCKPSAYILLTSISIKRPSSLRRISFDHTQLMFSDAVPRNFSRASIKLHDAVQPPRDLPEKFMKVRVRIQARSEFDAYELALKSLDFLRGIWNFAINNGYSRRWYSGPLQPVNTIFLGPVHTLHQPNGDLVGERYWYEPDYSSDSNPTTIKNWKEIEAETTKIRRMLKGHPYKPFMQEIFIRYAHSLDGTDHESSFLKSWSLLESLTAIGESQNFGEVINRILFLFEDEDYHRRILDHLRVRRNNSIHKGKGIVNAEGLIFQVKRYVEWLIWSHLVLRRQFESPQDYGQMLSSPRDPGMLEKKLRLLRAAQKLRPPTSARSRK